MAVPNRPPAQNKYPEQYMQNTSYDEDYGVLVNIPVTMNPVNGSLERPTAIQGNSSLTLGYTGDNLTTIQKTVGSTTYTKTLSYTGGKLTGITVWT